MNVLILCEESQSDCIAFRQRGHEAFSCDLKQCSGGHPEWHIVGDALAVLLERSQWVDLVIAHPPCTYLSKAGSCMLHFADGSIKNRDRYEKGLLARHFFLSILSFCQLHNIPCAIENSIPDSVFDLPPYSQIVYPCNFGSKYTKPICLWLYRLPCLRQPVHLPYRNNSISWVRSHSGSMLRSKSFHEISEAMADQWGDLNLLQLVLF